MIGEHRDDHPDHPARGGDRDREGGKSRVAPAHAGRDESDEDRGRRYARRAIDERNEAREESGRREKACDSFGGARLGAR